MIVHLEEISRGQLGVRQNAGKIMHRHHRYIGRLKEVQPFCGGSGLEQVGQPGVYFIDVRIPALEITESGVGLRQLGSVDGNEQSLPMLVGEYSRAEIAIAGLIGTAIG